MGGHAAAAAGCRCETGRRAPGARMELGEGNLPLQFHISPKTGENYQLDVGDLAKVTVLPSYGCAMMNGRLYPQERQELHKLNDLLNHMSVTQSNGKLDISEEQLNASYSMCCRRSANWAR